MDDRHEVFVAGEWRTPTGASPITLVSPHTGEAFCRAPAAGRVDVHDAVAGARRAFDDGRWSRLDPAERIAAVHRLAELYGGRRAAMAETISAEMGAPITFAHRAHVGLPWAMMRALCAIAERHAWTERRPGAFGGEVIVDKRPVGVVAAIVPWNMPQFLILTKLVPALLAGCSVVVKPAPETSLDALQLAELVGAAAIPPGVVSVIPGGAAAGRQLVEHPWVDKVSFTGSTAAGRHIAQACGRNLTPVTLELGGKSAAVVLDDAEPAPVAAAVRLASLSNSGQLCNALTRILVPRRRRDEFVDALVDTAASLRVGEPADPATDLGPLASQRQQQRVWEYIDAGIAEGAKPVLGGPGRPDGLERGWYVRPTVFTDVDTSMTIAREEVFGPVISVMSYDDEPDALRIANDSEYGLAGAVFTGDIDRGMDVARRVRSGTLGVNQGYNMDPAAPFGGVKDSGYGRELGPEGLDSYLETTSISVAPVER